MLTALVKVWKNSTPSPSSFWPQNGFYNKSEATPMSFVGSIRCCFPRLLKFRIYLTISDIIHLQTSKKSLGWWKFSDGSKYINVSIPIFKKKSLRRFLVTLLQWKVWYFFPEISAEIFSWKSAYLVPRYILKGPQHRRMQLHPCPAQKC